MKKSFSLIEILVVTTIIVLLTTVAIISYSQFTKTARDARRKTDLEQIKAALEMYRSSNDQYYSGSFDNNCGSVNWLSTYISTIYSDQKPTFYYYCKISANDYTLGTYLETGGSSSCGSCGPSTSCNFCVGPYGQK